MSYDELISLLPCMMYHSLICFFFQAEDGIRDTSVTGVQTCALPISRHRQPQRQGGAHAEGRFLRGGGRGRVPRGILRSEERRVGERRVDLGGGRMIKKKKKTRRRDESGRD